MTVAVGREARRRHETTSFTLRLGCVAPVDANAIFVDSASAKLKSVPNYLARLPRASCSVQCPAEEARNEGCVYFAALDHASSDADGTNTATIAIDVKKLNTNRVHRDLTKNTRC